MFSRLENLAIGVAFARIEGDCGVSELRLIIEHCVTPTMIPLRSLSSDCDTEYSLEKLLGQPASLREGHSDSCVATHPGTTCLHLTCRTRIAPFCRTLPGITAEYSTQRELDSSNPVGTQQKLRRDLYRTSREIDLHKIKMDSASQDMMMMSAGNHGQVEDAMATHGYTHSESIMGINPNKCDPAACATEDVEALESAESAEAEEATATTEDGEPIDEAAIEAAIQYAIANGERVRKIGPWIIGETLGEGGFSKVRVGTHERIGKRVALKLLKSDALKASADINKQVRAEINALSKLDNPHVTKLYGVDWNAKYEKRNGTVVEVILVVLELVTGGELFEFLSATGCFEEGIARTYFHQMVQAVAYCHSQNIVHRDLKPENILLGADFTLKLADFGFAAALQRSNPLMYTNCGTPTYMAPEMLTRGRGYDPTATDVWALGVILFIMLAGFPPFQQPSNSDWWFAKLAQNKHSLFWQAHLRNAYFTESAKDLINKMLCVDPSQRITLEGIMRHEWFNEPTIPIATVQNELARRKQRVDEARERKEQERRQARMQQGATSGESIISETYRSDDDLPDILPSLHYLSSQQEVQQRDQTQPESNQLASAEEAIAAAFSQLEVKESSELESTADSTQDSQQQLIRTETTEPSRPAPKIGLASAVACHTQFHSRQSPLDTYDQIADLLHRVGASVTGDRANYRMQATFNNQRGGVTIAINVYSPDSEETQGSDVRIRRFSGDSMVFRSIYARLHDALRKRKVAE